MAYFLNERDRAIVAEVIKRVGAGAGNHRPLARRRRQVSPAAAASTKPAMALVDERVDAMRYIDPGLLRPGLSLTACATLVYHDFPNRDDSLVRAVQEDDTNGPAPPDGQPWPQKDATREVINYTTSIINGKSYRPVLCHGYQVTFNVDGVDKRFFAVTDFVRNSIIEANAPSEVNGNGFNITSYNLVSGKDPLHEADVQSSVYMFNPFGFEISANSKFYAMQDDYQQWNVIQAECPI